MTGEIINLRKFRKDKARSEASQQAEANRAKFGMTKAEKRRIKSEQDRIGTALDGASLTSGRDGNKDDA